MDKYELIYDDKGLRFWEGGCTWISEGKTTIQLRKAFEKRERYLGYSRDEIIAHELVHVTRHDFDEPIFEEILAYQTSPSPFRRFFGPLFRSSKESTLFIAALSLALFATLFEIFLVAAYAAVLSLVVLGMGRLLRSQLIFSRARKRIGYERALDVMVHLTDREIIRFSKMKREEIEAYVARMNHTEPRWEKIAADFNLNG